MDRKKLVATARGDEKADLVIKNSELVNVYSGELLENQDVAVKENRIALVGDADHTIRNSTKIIDANGKYLAPGFLDGHVHIDDSMGTVTEFARIVLPRGTTGVFMDPHEIVNVLGLKGMELMLEESKNVPLRVFSAIPSCVPSTSSEFETTGGDISIDDVRDALEWEHVVGLGEVMDYPSVIYGEEEIHKMIEETLKAGKVVEGHSPGVSGKELNAYVSTRISSCHESTELEEALEKLRLGMYPMIREGFASIKNLSDLIGIITEYDVDPSRVCLVTDDRHPENLLNEGHIDHIIKRAIEEGVEPVKAIQMVTINTAEHFKVDTDLGGIAPGKFADMVLLDSLSEISINEVVVNGEIIARDGELVMEFGSYQYPDYVKNTVRIPRKVRPNDFDIRASENVGEVKVRVIGVEEKTPRTKHLIRSLSVSQEGLIQRSVDRDIAKVSVIDRHKDSGNFGLGFVSGFGFKEGAMATTIAHDSHNLLVIGMDDKSMAMAVNKISEVGGGIVTVKDDEILALLELPVAGLMSDQPLVETNEKMKEISQTQDELGFELDSPFTTLILLSLPVIPELRITDKGLIDVSKFEMVEIEV